VGGSVVKWESIRLRDRGQTTMILKLSLLYVALEEITSLRAPFSQPKIKWEYAFCHII